MTITLSSPRARNGVIGNDGALPWHLPEDLAHFKPLTHGQPVIMGRKTWESLPPRSVLCRAGERGRHARCGLAGRRRRAPASSLEDAIAICAHAPDVWVIGGARFRADRAALRTPRKSPNSTRDFEGDTSSRRTAALRLG